MTTGSSKSKPGAASSRLRAGTGVAQYRQLASLLRHRIAQGELAPGAQLPTVADMALQHAIARITVRQAYAVLADESLVRSRRGHGTFVTEHRPAAMDAGLRSAINDPTARDLKIEVLEQRDRVALPAELLRPGSSACDEGYGFVRKIHLHDGIPFCLAEIHVAADIQARFPKGGIDHQKIAWLISVHAPEPLRHMQQTLSVAPADLMLARTLGCEFSSPVAHMARWIFDARRRIAYAGRFWYRGDRFMFDVELPFDLWLQHPGMAIPEAREPTPARSRTTRRPPATRRRAA